MKPQTYMNLSGQSIAEAMRWYKIEPQHMLIISDDIDLPPGVIRLRSKGGAGTHNGWKSILQETGTDLFPRIRIGTGAPPPQWDLADWVLTGYSEENRQVMENAFALAAEAALCFAEHGIDLAMNRYNREAMKRLFNARTRRPGGRRRHPPWHTAAIYDTTDPHLPCCRLSYEQVLALPPVALPCAAEDCAACWVAEPADLPGMVFRAL